MLLFFEILGGFYLLSFAWFFSLYRAIGGGQDHEFSSSSISAGKTIPFERGARRAARRQM